MIRVLILSHSSELEDAVRSSPTLEFAGRVDLPPEISGDVLLVDGEAVQQSDWDSLADLPIPVLILASAPGSDVVTSALRAGIRGIIPADASAGEIESAVHAVHAGLVVTVPAFLPDPNPTAEDLPDPLSDRELEVLDLLAEGLPNKLIAHRLNISEHTVKTHVASIFVKLDASSRTEAVSRAIRRGFIML